MTSFCSRKPIFRQPERSKSLIIIPFARTGLSVDKALFPPVLITLVVVSSLSSTLTWISLLFLSPLCLPRTPYSDYTCVKVLLSNHSPLQFLNLYSPPIRNSPSDSRTRTFYPDILSNSPDTFILGDFNAHYPSWDRLIPPNPLEMTCFADHFLRSGNSERPRLSPRSFTIPLEPFFPLISC